LDIVALLKNPQDLFLRYRKKANLQGLSERKAEKGKEEDEDAPKKPRRKPRKERSRTVANEEKNTGNDTKE